MTLKQFESKKIYIYKNIMHEMISKANPLLHYPDIGGNASIYLSILVFFGVHLKPRLNWTRLTTT